MDKEELSFTDILPELLKLLAKYPKETLEATVLIAAVITAFIVGFIIGSCRGGYEESEENEDKKIFITRINRTRI